MILDTNEAFTEILGFAREEAIGRSTLSDGINSWVRDQDRAGHVAKLGGGRAEDTVAELRRKDGRIITAIVSSNRIEYDRQNCMISVIRDISARQESEKKLRESEEQYRVLFEDAAAQMLIVDRQGKIVDANKQSMAATGFTLPEILAMSLAELDPSDDAAPRNQPSIGQRINEGGQHTFRATRRRKDGTSFPIEVSALSIIWKGKPAMMRIAQDITDQLLLESEYIKTQAILESAIDNQRQVGIVAVDKNYRCLYMNRAYREYKSKVQGIDAKIGDCLLDHLSRDKPLEHSLPYYRDAFQGVSGRFEEETSEKTMPQEIFFNPLYGKNSEIIGATAFSIDISNLLESMNKLRVSEERFRVAMDASRDAIWDYDVATDQPYFSPALAKMLGHEADEQLFLRSWRYYANSEEFSQATQAFADYIHGRSQVFNIDVSATLGNGPRKWLNVRGYIVERDTHGAAKRIVGTIHDITAKKNMESKLLTKESQLRIIGDNIPVFIAIVGARDERYQYANKMYERALGLRQDQIVGMHMREVIGEESYAFASPYIREVLRGRESRYESQFELVQGKTWVRLEYVPYFDGDGIVERFLVLGIDITEMKNLLHEKDLVLHEAHHRVKNNLNAVGSFLALREGLCQSPEARKVLEEAALQTNAMIQLYQDLYVSSNPGRVRLDEFLPNILRRSLSTFGREENIELVTGIDGLELPAKIATNVGIIANELLTNSLKYAFSGIAAPAISMTARADGGLLQLEYADNGVGLPAGFSLAEAKGFGMTIMTSLASAYGGSMTATSDGGAHFHITIPLPDASTGRDRKEL